ncbi:hypothetical protein BOX15_Mlig008367g1, partial [Macrostomum lignano]
DTLVTQSDYDTLHDGMWLNDNIISFALEYIDRTKCRGSSNGTQRITLLDPTVCQAVKLTGQAVELLAQRDLRASAGSSNTRGLLGVVSDSDSPDQPGGTHWSLLAIRYVANSNATNGACRIVDALHFDSLSGNNRHSAADLAAALHPALCDCPNALPTVREAAGCARQANSSDCGAFVLLYAEQLVDAASPDDWPLMSAGGDGRASEAVRELRARYRRLIEQLAADGPVYKD